MAADEYDKVELPALEQLQALGWDYLHGSALAPDTSIERSSFRESVLAARLTSAALAPGFSCILRTTACGRGYVKTPSQPHNRCRFLNMT